ncbi:MAG: ABC transporter ATP-binding protein [Candidatus Omnitrophica bacterium]|nr:ABC transporter ATP-binding protein [Candidatus Omnitrophota bacterium]
MLKVKNLKKYFRKNLNTVKAVDDISFTIPKGETFGLVGGSGSGKTTLAKILTGIVKPDGGSFEVDGSIDMIFQDPYNSLNPRLKIKDIVAEPLLVKGISKNKAYEKVEQYLKKVGIRKNSPLFLYPHEFSGGERQRISIARSIIHEPDLLILDEPVSSLDVIVGAKIIDLIKDLQKEMNLTYLFISHDIRLVQFLSNQIAFMQNGKIVEVVEKTCEFNSPKSPYAKTLIESVPVF